MDYLDRLLANDPLQDACDITGTTLEDPETAALGFRLKAELAAEKHQALTQAGDTSYGSYISEYLDVVENCGFEALIAETFELQLEDEETSDAHLMVFWHPGRKALLILHTFQFSFEDEPVVSKATLFCDWVPEGGAPRWTGYEEVNEGLARSLATMDREGAYNAPWEHAETVRHLLSYGLSPESEEISVFVTEQERTVAAQTRWSRIDEKIRSAIGIERLHP